MEPMPWSMNQLKKLGHCIRDDEPVSPGLPNYDDVMVHYNDVGAEVQEEIRRLDWESLLGDKPYEVTSRAKTIDTLREKLRRERTTPLPNVQDIAGVRFEAEMSLDEQDAVVHAIAGLFDHDPTDCVRDLRRTPHSGYRAVHLWLRLPVRVEVQVRTHLQGEWANTYERLADVFGRNIRYGDLPDDGTMREATKSLQQVSLELIKYIEISRNEWNRLAARLNAAAELAEPTADAAVLGDVQEAEEYLATLGDAIMKGEQDLRFRLRQLNDEIDRVRSQGKG